MECAGETHHHGLVVATLQVVLPHIPMTQGGHDVHLLLLQPTGTIYINMHLLLLQPTGTIYINMHPFFRKKIYSFTARNTFGVKTALSSI